ncbi:MULTISPECIES: glycosyl hydrolase family 8 [unclassified Vibrio]|uniref:Glucanase n=1 Tax=Vibrio sp. HB236076 TaxID=3232307 RepID=A0AB39HEV8_9VIBR|nr:glycosyl hydrolase family 8 [Vibrio sp. HB161653]MDP5255364.1 glycosyl hydrolase family 8 [Vibrio sp. HB161653]
MATITPYPRLKNALLAACVAVGLSHCTPQEPSPFQDDWQHYKARFLQHGRVVDTANQDISHSEGQGYGMLFAVHAQDKSAFRQLWQWTQAVLARDDHLYSWKYQPCPSRDKACVSDSNNASDGDILIAWALLLAAEQWQEPDWQQAALQTLNAVKSKLITRRFGHLILLPAEYGFEPDKARVQLNLSYWVFPALEQFSQQTQDPIWHQLYLSGEQLIELAQFGQWHLPPDWVMLTEQGLTLEGALSPDYAYNACRIPLYIAMSDHGDRALLTPFLNFWQQDKVPGTVNLSDNSHADYTMNSGMQSIATSVQHRYQPHHNHRDSQAQASKSNAENSGVPLPSIDSASDYYSASLILLSQLSLLKENPKS